MQGGNIVDTVCVSLTKTRVVMMVLLPCAACVCMPASLVCLHAVCVTCVLLVVTTYPQRIGYSNGNIKIAQ